MTDSATPRKAALITGAGSGIGRDTAMLLAESGYAVALLGRTQEKLDAAAAMIRDEANPDAEILVIVADVTDSSAVDAAVEKTVAAFGRLDAVVNAAGQAPLAVVERIEDAELDACLDVNLKAFVYLARAAWPAFRENGRDDAGVLVGLSAMAIHTPHQKFSFYAAAKAGVEAFVANAATEGQRLGIRCYAVAPRRRRDRAAPRQLLRAGDPAGEGARPDLRRRRHPRPGHRRTRRRERRDDQAAVALSEASATSALARLGRGKPRMERMETDGEGGTSRIGRLFLTEEASGGPNSDPLVKRRIPTLCKPSTPVMVPHQAAELHTRSSRIATRSGPRAAGSRRDPDPTPRLRAMVRGGGGSRGPVCVADRLFGLRRRPAVWSASQTGCLVCVADRLFRASSRALRSSLDKTAVGFDRVACPMVSPSRHPFSSVSSVACPGCPAAGVTGRGPRLACRCPPASRNPRTVGGLGFKAPRSADSRGRDGVDRPAPAGHAGVVGGVRVLPADRRGDEAHEHRLGPQRAAGQFRVELAGEEEGVNRLRQLQQLHDRLLRVAPENTSPAASSCSMYLGSTS